jgi:hypothetical protein
VPVVEAIADRVGDPAAFGHLREAGLEPELHLLYDRLRLLLAHGFPHLGRQAADLGLDVIEQLNARQRFGGDRCIAANVNLVEPSPEMRLMSRST